MREPHAGEKAYKLYTQPQTFDEKMAHAQELQKAHDIKNVTIAVDSMEELAHRKFGRLPNMVYIVDKKATIIFKSMWTRSEQVAEVLEELVREDQPAAS